jgi:hypothetical protein
MNRIAIAVISPILVLFSSIALHAQTPQSLQIVQATYGAGDTQMDVTEKVQAAIASGQTSFRADNSFFGKDPIFGKVKTLSVVFVRGGVQYETTAREGDQFSFAQSNVAQSNVPQQAPSTPTDAPAIQPTQQRRLAPEGVFFLTERMILRSNSGVVGFAPGTRVRVVQDKGETFNVTDGSTTFDVPADELTNDLDLAALVARSDAKSQQTVAQWIERQNAAGRQQHGDYIAMLEQQQQEVSAGRAAADAVAPHSSGNLDRGAYNQTDALVYPYWYHGHRHATIYRTHNGTNRSGQTK